MKQPAVPDEPGLKKSERTRAAILDAALRLFQESGYEGATMRAIAAEAGVSLGNAYYYFESKEHLIQGFYARMHEEHLRVCEPILARERRLDARLRGVLLAKIDTSEPFHRFSGVLFKTAADPKSPLNPFSAASKPVRREATELMQRVISGSKQKPPADLAEKLPELLWLYEMAVILFWIHDESKGRARTRKLIDSTVDVITKLVSIGSFPLLKPLRGSALALLDDLRADALPAPTSKRKSAK
ncbi:MAG TPA: TetR family transcriptional regulator [Planctomycetota bacterium]|nr:TetR family transcriptional regulator [Planctomycetota bacterium]